MDVLYRLGRATAADVRAALPGEPADSTVRTHLRILEEKGQVRHLEEGLRYVYLPVTPRRDASRRALRHLVDTFFEGSTAQVVGALLGTDASRLTNTELDRIAAIVAKARKEQGK